MMAGRERRRDILMPSPHVYAMAPKVHDRRWKKNMARNRKKTAKQSLKHRRTKTLWSRFERIRSGKTYGGT
jgi:hypothetical protein